MVTCQTCGLDHEIEITSYKKIKENNKVQLKKYRIIKLKNKKNEKINKKKISTHVNFSNL
jgi:hypothetical protein